MDLKDLESRIEVLEKEVKALKDIDNIKTLQRAYGYYLEHWMSEEVIDCFSDSPKVVLGLYEGTWLGKEGIRKYFTRENISPEFLHQVMQLSPIIDLDPDGNRAKGRWYSWGAGTWKILKLEYSLQIAADPRVGWVGSERVATIDSNVKRKYAGPKPDVPPHGMDTRYPSGFIFPFHYKHPVTGKETSEARRNASLKFVPNRFAAEE